MNNKNAGTTGNLIDEERADFEREPISQTQAIETWQQRLCMLAAKLPHLNIGPDLAGMTAADLWGVYRFISNRVAT